MMLPWKNRIAAEYREWKTVFYVSLALNGLAYLGYIVHYTYAVDDYVQFSSGVNHLAHGRWFADFIYNVLMQKNAMPTLAPVIGMTGYILSGIGLCKLWGIATQNRLGVIALWSLHPYLLDAYNFRIATVICAVVHLLTVAALLLAPRGKKAFLAAVILLYVALSTYQVALGFAVAAIMMQTLILCVREEFSKDALLAAKKSLFSYAGMLFLAVVLYFILTKAIFIALDVETNPRIQAGFLTGLDQLTEKIAVVGTVLFVRLMPIKEFILPLAGKAAIFIIYGLAVFTALRKAPCALFRWCAVIWIALIPIGAVCFILPIRSSDMPWRTTFGLVVFAAGMFALTQESPSYKVRRASAALCIFLAAFFIVNNTIMIHKQYLTNQKDVVIGNRIIAKIQSLDNFRPGMPLAVVGRFESDSFSKEGKTHWQIIREYAEHCSTRTYSLAQSAFETDWSKYSFLLNYLELELRQSSPEQMEQARQWAKTRTPWPDPSSVFIQDNVAVIILSRPDP